MKESDIIKLTTLAYWKNDRHHITGAIECRDADVLTMSRNLLIAETEVKISIADLRREIKTKRYKHWRMNNMCGGDDRYGLLGGVNYFYFVVPERLKDKALEIVRERYPYAGLLVCRENIENIFGFQGEPSNVYSVKPAKRMQRPKPGIAEIIRISYAVSNTTLRYGNKLLENKK